MRKSVYSLVLMDEVVSEIDRLAYEKNTNRSNLINQILAETVGFTTPEMRMHDIFQKLEDILSESCYQIVDRSSDSMFSVRSALRYKYRPTVKYSIELFREPKDIIGRLKVSFRTSSQSFLSAVEDFFTGWMEMENNYLINLHPEGVPAKIESTGYSRGFLKITEEMNLTEREMATAIGEYIKVLDTSLKFYFEHIDEKTLTEAFIRRTYKEYLSCGVILV